MGDQIIGLAAAAIPTPANSIDEQWHIHAAVLMPRNATDGQRRDMKRSFYTGASSMILLINRMKESNLQTSVAVQMIAGWESELDAFSDLILRGEA